MTKYNNLFPYMGSKISMLTHLLKDEVLPTKGDVLVEPFLGSCSLLLNTNYNKYYLNDSSKYVFDFISVLLNVDLEVLEEQYNILVDKFVSDDKEKSKEFFYKVRDLYFAKYDILEDIKKASIFLFLQNNGFSGKPISTSLSCGHTDRKIKMKKEVYLDFQAKKNKIFLFNMDYKDFIKEVLRYEKQEDIVLYLDPPYIDSFKYQKDNKVDEFVTEILDYYKNYDFLITIQSNFKHKDILRLYNDYNIIEVDRKLSVQAGSDDAQTKTEVIIVKDERYKPTRDFELKILINWLVDKDYDPKIIAHYKRELRYEN